MTTLTSSTISILRPHRALVPVLLTAVLLNVLAAAPPAATSPPAAEEPKQSEPKDKAQALIDNFDRVRFTNEFTTHYYYSHPPSSEPPVFLFPPVPPPLGLEYPLLGPLVTRTPAPPELAAYVDEWFYPLLGARLIEGDLPQALRAQIQAYRTAKVALQSELRSRIAALKNADPAERERQLDAFASVQAPKIAALETTEEKIRSDLRPSGLFGSLAGNGDAAEKSGWRLRAGREAPATPEDRQLESEAMRGVAFYQEGLSAPQRRLLLAAAVELETVADSPPGANPTPAEGWLLHFSPEPASIRLLANLPAPLAKKISEYVATKKGLTTELCDTLRRNNDAGGSTRIEALKRLAADQAPHIAALEAVAEEIRRKLTDVPNPPGPPAPQPLPPELMVRISVYRGHKLAVLKTLHSLLAEPAGTVDVVPAAGDGKTGTAGGNPPPVMVQPANLRVSVEEFNRRQNALVGELNAERAAIREALSDYGRTTNRPTDRKSIDDLLKDFENARQQQEIWDRYRDYQTAVLLPGLSPEQRRLLFSAAVEQLALPLPAGVSLP
jgi:hypothetical protein